MIRRSLDRSAKPIFLPMDTQGQAFPKPGPREKSQPKDGRLIESPSRYRISKRALWAEQNQRCGKEGCRNFMPTPAHGHRHHPGGRGIGGSKRDDSKTVLWCLKCHKEYHDPMRKLAFRKSA